MHELYFNGQWHAADAPLFSAQNRSFKYGDGFFESFKIIHGKWSLEQYHFDRIRNGLLTLGMVTVDGFHEQIKEIIEGKTNKTWIGAGRLSIFRKDGLKYTPSSDNIDWCLEISKGTAENLYPPLDQGLNIDIADSIQLHPDKFSAIKSANALPYVMASREKSMRYLDELLIMNTQHQLVEACAANLFIMKGSELFTPPLSSGALDGIIRKWIINQGAERINRPIKERNLGPKDLEKADEIWLSNTSYGIRWVKNFRKHIFAGLKANQMQTILRNYVTK